MPTDPLGLLPDGSTVLIDANIFIYAASSQSSECEGLLTRCAKEDIFGIVTVEILSGVCHRRMVAEAYENGLITRESATSLRRKRNLVTKLHRYQEFVDQILNLNLLVIDLDEARLRRSGTIRSRFGLLTTDSLILAAAEIYGIRKIATLDEDFDVASWLTVYKPMDIQ